MFSPCDEGEMSARQHPVQGERVRVMRGALAVPAAMVGQAAAGTVKVMATSIVASTQGFS
jgi:hypothetical protein